MTLDGNAEYLVRVLSDGIVEWSPGDIFKTYCLVDVTLYPFDSQVCNITLSTWMSTVTQVDIYPLSVSLQRYITSVEWDVQSTDTYREMQAFNCCPDEETVTVQFILKLSRRSTFCVLTTILPVSLITLLIPVGFILPPHSGEKVTVSASVFLSFSLFVSLLNESMPRTSLSTALLGIFMLALMGAAAASVCFSSVRISAFHRASDDNSCHDNATAKRKSNKIAEQQFDFVLETSNAQNSENNDTKY